MSTIEPVTMYRYRGQVFESPGKAIDHAEDLVVRLLRQPLLDKGFTITDVVKILETVLQHRRQLLDFLDYELELPEDHS